MDRKFNHTAAVLDKLVWKCDMTNPEIKDTFDIMNGWLSQNVVSGKYQWYTPPYSKGDVAIEHNGDTFIPCICFENQDDLQKYRDRFGCIR